MNARSFSLPADLENRLRTFFETKKSSLDRGAELARGVKSISDHFTGVEGLKTPWQWALGYMIYYFPLNVVRLQAVFEESFRDFPWDKVSRIIDFGSGPGTAHAALEATSLAPKEILAVENDHRALEIHRALDFKKWPVRFALAMPAKIESGTLGIFSYSLLEEDRMLPRLQEFDHLLIVTPSTQNQGRKLLEIRENLRGTFSSWAPCTHQNVCPLLSKSQRDWCHDRIAFDAPDWFRALEAHLPFYNHTLTYSYWFASRTELAPDRTGFGRTIGDTLYEKGKVRQMVCRGPNREFLAWLRKHGEPAPIPRGSLVAIPPASEIKGNEIRL
jgi:hypothetical protein